MGLEASRRAAHEGGVYNLGNGQGYSNLEVVRTCAEVSGRDVEIEIGPRRPGDPAVLVASAEKAARNSDGRLERGELARDHRRCVALAP